ncbi:MAG: EAL domain-containing protein [Coriobacteriia bacterium]|nr:EAL domain-containing protein [Coriobacteriia bacterium]
MFERLGDIAARFARRKLVRTLNTAFVRLIPFITIGSIAQAILNLPIPIIHNFLVRSFGGSLIDLAAILTDSTLTVITLAALASISLSYTVENSDVWEGEPNLFVPVFTAFSCFIILFVWQGPIISLTDIVGTNSIFKAILVSLLACKLLFLFIQLIRSVKQRLHLRSLSRGYDANPAVQSAFDHVLPVALTLVSFVVIRVIGLYVIDVANLDALYAKIAGYMREGSLIVVVLVMFFSQLLAFCGAHNFVLFNLLPSLNDTTASVSSVFSLRGYYLHFGIVGGSGTMFGLLIALAIVGRKWYWGRRFARASVFPVIFNINEPLLYGFPVFLNPFYVIPFILAPIISAVLSFLCFKSGWIPPITNMVNWTTPPLLSGYLATGSLRASVLQAVCILASVVLYYPFVRAHHIYELKQRSSRFADMQAAAEAALDGYGSPVTERIDAVGQIAREYAMLLKQSVRQNQLPFYLVFQPKTNRQGKVVGAEALLRWEDPEMGFISPLTAVELMNESGLATELGRWVIENAVRNLAEMRESHMSDLRVSINLDPRHLEEDPGFAEFVKKIRDTYVIIPGEVEFEITEHIAINANDEMRELFRAIRDMGFGLSIDDLGMGYSSLNYINDYGVRTVKIAMQLINNIQSDYKQREIVRSVVQLADHLNLEVVIEGVETEEQADILSSLGAQIFQGYYFSRPLNAADFQAYVSAHR